MKRIPSKTLVRKPGFHWRLVVHLFIIAGLLYAISFTRRKIEETKAERAAAEIRIAAKQAADREKALAEARARVIQGNIPPVLPTPDETMDPAPAPQAAPAQGDPAAPATAMPVDDTPPPPALPGLPAEIISLNQKARELLAAADEKRGAALAENARTLMWNLETHLQTLPKSGQTAGMPHVRQISNAISNGRVPDPAVLSDDPEPSPEIIGITRHASEKQAGIDRGFLDESARIHNAYLRRIREAAAKAGSAGDIPLARALGNEINAAEDLESWLQKLGFEAAP
jgi:hypothetical protein